MQSILSSLVAGRYIRTRAKTQEANKPILNVFLRDHTWAFILIFGMLWLNIYFFVSMVINNLWYSHIFMGYTDVRTYGTPRRSRTHVSCITFHTFLDVPN